MKDAQTRPLSQGISKAADFGRIIGASAVFYYHIGLVAGYPLSRWGEYAVAFFIILSGTVYTGFSSISPTDLPSYRRYIVSRVRAVFPMFIIINCAIFISSFRYPPGSGRPFTFIELLFSATGLSQYCHHRYLSAVMWFIPFIMQVYLVLPILDQLLKRASDVLVIVVAFGISLSCITLVFSVWPSRAVEICGHWSVIFRLPEVCVGAILGRCIFFRSDRYGGLIALAAFAFLSFVLATTVASHFVSQAYILSLPGRV